MTLNVIAILNLAGVGSTLEIKEFSVFASKLFL